MILTGARTPGTTKSTYVRRSEACSPSARGRCVALGSLNRGAGREACEDFLRRCGSTASGSRRDCRAPSAEPSTVVQLLVPLAIACSSSSSGPGGSSTLHISGYLDLSDRQELVNAAIDAILTSDSITIDASEPDFIDVSGIEALTEITRAAERERTKFSVNPRSRHLDRVLELLDMTDHWA